MNSNALNRKCNKNENNIELLEEQYSALAGFSLGITRSCHIQ